MKSCKIQRLPNIFWQGKEYYWYSNVWYDEIKQLRKIYTDCITGRPWIPDTIPEEYNYIDIAIRAYKETFNKLYLSIYLPIGFSPEYYRRIHKYNQRIQK
jgi:hypothetical protein